METAATHRDGMFYRALAASEIFRNSTTQIYKESQLSTLNMISRNILKLNIIWTDVLCQIFTKS